MQTLDYKSTDPARVSKLAVGALVYGVIIGPISPVLTWLVFGDVPVQLWLITPEQRDILFESWLMLVGIAVGLVAAKRAARLKLRGKQLAYIGSCISVLWASAFVAVFFHIIRIP